MASTRQRAGLVTKCMAEIAIRVPLQLEQRAQVHEVGARGTWATWVQHSAGFQQRPLDYKQPAKGKGRTWGTVSEETPGKSRGLWEGALSTSGQVKGQDHPQTHSRHSLSSKRETGGWSSWDGKTDDGNRSWEEASKGKPKLALGHLAPESVFLKPCHPGAQVRQGFSKGPCWRDLGMMTSGQG